MTNSPNVIDLFAGAGGLSLGAARAGFCVSAAVEIDPFATETHLKNFPNTKHSSESVANLTGRQLLAIAGLPDGGLDGLIGGPPCQGFSFMGRRQVDDVRNDLFVHFFRLVAETRPRFFVAENVPGIRDPRYDHIREAAFSHVREAYTIIGPIEVKASLYGAPTTRTRIFFIGYDPRRMTLNEEAFAPSPDIEIVNVGRALEGLPLFIDPAWQSEASGWRKVDLMQKGHFAEHLRNDVPPGVGHQASIDRLLEKSEVSGCMGTRHLPEVIARFAKLAPGQQDSVSKGVRLNPSGFCPTLRAGTGSDRGSYQAVRPIHHVEPRVITPREAARLQGFPDWFAFHRTKWHSFRQIGNSVSPIVAENVLSVIRAAL
ncbi:DNA cytosine methyltransferase [Chromobacterium amazonense]|uniref:DNA cytosine methyltransferase n=1 Tax=Chromobacterium amazonense TaxID=1382803 RepID=UPI0031F703EF